MRQIFNDGQEIIHEDLNDLVVGFEHVLQDVFLNSLLQKQTNAFMGQSFRGLFNNATTVTLKAGWGLQFDNSFSLPEPKQRMIFSRDNISVPITAAHATLPRIDLICVKHDFENDVSAGRWYKAAIDSVPTMETLVVRRVQAADVVLVTGVANADPQVPSTPSGYLPLCEIFVTPATGIANQAALRDIRAKFSWGQYDYVVGPTDDCTHTELSEAMLDAVEGSRVFVKEMLEIENAVSVPADRVLIDFNRAAGLKSIGASRALFITGQGVQINSGLFVDFDGAGDVAIEFDTFALYGFCLGNTFKNCTDSVVDSSFTVSVLGSVSL